MKSYFSEGKTDGGCTWTAFKRLKKEKVLEPAEPKGNLRVHGSTLQTLKPGECPEMGAQLRLYHWDTQTFGFLLQENRMEECF